jgi:DNA sulfur modification protein DndD
MIFKELVLQNFGPYAGRHVINLRPEKDSNPCPIILIGGMNGGGKTTLMDAIRLALYGQRAQCSTRGNLSYSDFLTQSVNHHTSPGEQTRIELSLEHIQEGKWVDLRIVRYWTKNPKDGKDHLGILEEDWLENGLTNTWDEYIETLLPLGISNLFLFDGEQVKELAEQETPPTAVVEAMQVLLGLELAERLATDLEVLINRKRKAIANVAQLSNWQAIEAKLEQYQQEKETTKQALDSWQHRLKKCQSKYREAADKFRSEGGKIAAQRSQLESEIHKLDRERENQQESLRNLAAGILPLRAIAPLLHQAKQQAERELKFQQTQIAHEILLERDGRLLEYLKALSLTTVQLEKIEFFLKQENQNLQQENNPESPAWLEVDEEKLKQLVNLVEHQLPLQINLAEKHLENLNQLAAEIELTERQLAVAASPEEYQQLDNALKEAQQELLKAQSEYEAGNRRYEEVKRNLEKTKKELDKYSEKIIVKKTNEHLVQSVMRVQQTLELFRERLTLKKLNKLEGEITDCFRYLLHKSDLVHRVVIDTYSFSLSLYDRQGNFVPKHRLSAGEKQLLAIAFLWGLARVSGCNLPVAIDTPLGRLDSSHRSNLVERYFPAASHQVILLSTDTEIGKTEVEHLREQEAIAHEYLLKYDSSQGQTIIQSGYFW